MKLTAHGRRELARWTSHSPALQRQIDVALMSDGNLLRKITETLPDPYHPSGCRKSSHGWELWRMVPRTRDGVVLVNDRVRVRDRLTVDGLAYAKDVMNKRHARAIAGHAPHAPGDWIDGPLPKRAPRESATGPCRRATLRGVK